VTLFCIGFNKTGTTTLHQWFMLAGLRGSHDATYQRRMRTMGENELRAYPDAHDAFTDGERADFARLRALYPDARFVLNTGALKPWLESRVKHVFRDGGIALDRRDGTLRPGPLAGPMAQEYLRDPAQAISDWIDRRDFYHRSVLFFFAGDPALLVVNVTENPSWQVELGSFLGIEIQANLHANPTSADVAEFELDERIRQVSAVLRDKQIPPDEWCTETHVGFGPARS